MARSHPRDRVLTAGLWVPSQRRNCNKLTRTARFDDRGTSLRQRKRTEYRGSSMPYFVKIIIELIKMHKRASHSSGMSKENSPSCKAAVGLAFQKSLGQKGAGGDHLGQPRLNARRAAEHPPRSKIFLFHPKNAFSCSRASRFICIVWVEHATLRLMSGA